jgi:uncharacterized membrane protein
MSILTDRERLEKAALKRAQDIASLEKFSSRSATIEKQWHRSSHQIMWIIILLFLASGIVAISKTYHTSFDAILQLCGVLIVCYSIYIINKIIFMNKIVDEEVKNDN